MPSNRLAALTSVMVATIIALASLQRQVVVLNHASLVNVDSDSSSDRRLGEKSIRADSVAEVNSHLPEDGFDYTDSSLACEPCITGPNCFSGCLVVKRRISLHSNIRQRHADNSRSSHKSKIQGLHTQDTPSRPAPRAAKASAGEEHVDIAAELRADERAMERRLTKRMSEGIANGFALLKEAIHPGHAAPQPAGKAVKGAAATSSPAAAMAAAAAGVRRAKGQLRPHRGGILAEQPAAAPRRATFGSVSRGAKAAMPFPESEDSAGFVHCAAGNCEKLESLGVNVDDWGYSRDALRRMVPSLILDPSNNATLRRMQNQRLGRFARYDVSSQPGVHTPNVSWGAASGVRFFDRDRSPGAQALEQRGVWVNGLHFADGTEPVLFPNQTDAASDVKLESLGVKVEAAHVNVVGVTCDGPDLPDCRTSVDGVPDHLVEVQHVPKHRKEGVAAQERPSAWILDPQADWDGPQPQAEADGMEHY